MEGEDTVLRLMACDEIAVILARNQWRENSGKAIICQVNEKIRDTVSF